MKTEGPGLRVWAAGFVSLGPGVEAVKATDTLALIGSPSPGHLS